MNEHALRCALEIFNCVLPSFDPSPKKGSPINMGDLRCENLSIARASQPHFAAKHVGRSRRYLPRRPCLTSCFALEAQSANSCRIANAEPTRVVFQVRSSDQFIDFFNFGRRIISLRESKTPARLVLELIFIVKQAKTAKRRSNLLPSNQIFLL